MLSRELDAPVVSSGVKALHEEAMERAQGHTRRALLADPGGDQHLACLFGGRAGGLLHPACYKSIPACDISGAKNAARKLEEHDGHKSEGQDGASPGTHAPQSPRHGWLLRDSEPWI